MPKTKPLDSSVGWRAAAVVLPLSLAACGGPEAAARTTPTSAPAEPRPAARVERVSTVVVTPLDARSIEDLYRQGERAFAAQRWDDAGAAFDRVARAEPRGPLAARATFNAGFAHDNAARHEEALDRYEAVAERYPTDALAWDARVRSMRLLLYLNRWERAGTIADAVLVEHRSVGDLGLIVTYTAKALALIGGADPELASPFIERGRSIVERAGLARGGTVHRDLAQLYFALGELRRLRGERIVFDPRPPDFARALERRCQLLLDAQSAYSDAMRAYDAHWSAMAGYRVGELYQRLHRDLMQVPRPDAAVDGKRAALFDGAMRLRYSVLLKKGLAMMEHTVALGERTGERSEWVGRARGAKEDIERIIKEEQALLEALPYTRAELQAALDALRQKSPPIP